MSNNWFCIFRERTVLSRATYHVSPSPNARSLKCSQPPANDFLLFIFQFLCLLVFVEVGQVEAFAMGSSVPMTAKVDCVARMKSTKRAAAYPSDEDVTVTCAWYPPDITPFLRYRSPVFSDVSNVSTFASLNTIELTKAQPPHLEEGSHISKSMP